MLHAHFAAVERRLLAASQVAHLAGHTLHRGTPREAFIREFLNDHLSTRVAIGTGEIIDANSEPREQRNQFDLVIYNPDYPRIDLGGGVNAFLAEAVLATIEVKSLLTKDGLEQAITAAEAAKRLQRNFIGTPHVGIRSYVVAYDGPAQIKTVYEWLMQIEQARGLNQQNLPATGAERRRVLSQSVEGVFVLGKGSLVFDNALATVITDEMRRTCPTGRVQFFSSADSNLFWLFLLITMLTLDGGNRRPDLIPYLARTHFDVLFGP